MAMIWCSRVRVRRIDKPKCCVLKRNILYKKHGRLRIENGVVSFTIQPKVSLHNILEDYKGCFGALRTKKSLTLLYWERQKEK
jgi:hypothetical protein